MTLPMTLKLIDMPRWRHVRKSVLSRSVKLIVALGHTDAKRQDLVIHPQNYPAMVFPPYHQTQTSEQSET